MTKDSLIQQAFEVAAERYAAVGVDVRNYRRVAPGCIEGEILYPR